MRAWVVPGFAQERELGSGASLHQMITQRPGQQVIALTVLPKT
jgi:hypothetical protein